MGKTTNMFSPPANCIALTVSTKPIQGEEVSGSVQDGILHPANKLCDIFSNSVLPSIYDNKSRTLSISSLVGVPLRTHRSMTFRK